ncbi:hypothetical protein [Gracilibacillus thailandensis]|uniref:Uncharacterized protein n=1 Tax=Gracilibacillus thailandensis TaxID=563735 RepID=A0A6N7QSX9_9BACI|nr:hypothetical protein [Gracilibacillus thailandensis]MRI65118.1 hypothetical protein [Gracilibacillus thailandensis]
MKTLNDVLESGGKIQIYYFEPTTKEEAMQKLKPFMDLGELDEKESDQGTKWLAIESDKVVVTAFYGDKEERLERAKEELQHA